MPEITFRLWAEGLVGYLGYNRFDSEMMASNHHTDPNNTPRANFDRKAYITWPSLHT